MLPLLLLNLKKKPLVCLYNLFSYFYTFEIEIHKKSHHLPLEGAAAAYFLRFCRPT